MFINPLAENPFIDPFEGNVHYHISRRDIETSDLAATLKILEPLLESRKSVLSNKGKIHLYVKGYDSDRRELWEIAEVRNFFEKLDEKFSYWFWFCNDPDNITLKVITDCLFFTLAKGTADGKGAAINDVQLSQFMYKHYKELDDLCERYNVEASERQNTRKEIEKYYDQFYRKSNWFGRFLLRRESKNSEKLSPYAYERFFPEKGGEPGDDGLTA